MNINISEVFTSLSKNPLSNNSILKFGNNNLVMFKQDDESTYANEIKEIEEKIKNENISKIYKLMKHGGKLSPKEMEYLKKNAPWLYEKAVKIEKERELFKRELERCKTKEEADRVMSVKISLCHKEARFIESCPDLSEEEKEEKLEFIAMRIAAIQDEYTEFTKSKQYQNLPSDNKGDNRDSGKTTTDKKVFLKQRSVDNYSADLENDINLLSVNA